MAKLVNKTEVKYPNDVMEQNCKQTYFIFIRITIILKVI